VKCNAENQDGFTLVELLVSMALLSLMAIYTIQAFSTLRNMNRIEANIAAQMDVDAVVRHLRDEIANTHVVMSEGIGATSKLFFEGNVSNLKFVTTSNGERETGGLYLVQLQVDADGTLISKRQLLGTKSSEHIDEVILLRNVNSIAFSYVTNGNPPSIANQWTANNTLPNAVQINLSFKDGDTRKWSIPTIRIATAF
jgi:general secretion pathway protein J